MTLSFLDTFSKQDPNTGQPGVVDLVLAVRKKKPAAGPDVKLILQIVLAGAFVMGLLMWDNEAQANTAFLTLYLGDQRRVFAGEVADNMTVLDAINAAAVAGNLKFQFAVEDNKTKIVNLGGLSADSIENRYALFLNFQRLNPEEISTIPVRSNDSIVLKILTRRPQ